MKLLLIIMMVLLGSCGVSNPEKPFLVIQVNMTDVEETGVVKYSYKSANGFRISFHGREGDYAVGDTIK